jgi:hypothetical protein
MTGGEHFTPPPKLAGSGFGLLAKDHDADDAGVLALRYVHLEVERADGKLCWDCREVDGRVMRPCYLASLAAQARIAASNSSAGAVLLR